MKTYQPKTFFEEKNVRGQAENNAKKLSVEIYFVSSQLTYRVIAAGAQVLSIFRKQLNVRGTPFSARELIFSECVRACFVDFHCNANKRQYLIS